MYNAPNSVFVWNGIQYVVKKQPSRLWPCQNCDLSEHCDSGNFGSEHFPQCRARQREDHTDVVFFEFTEPVRRRSPREAQ